MLSRYFLCATHLFCQGQAFVEFVDFAGPEAIVETVFLFCHGPIHFFWFLCQAARRADL